MTLPPIQPQAAPLDVQLMARRTDLSEEQKIGEAARQFEAVLLRQILAQARQPAFRSGLFPESTVNTIYQDMITERLADGISRSGTLGLADTLRKQLVQQAAPKNDGSKPALSSP